MVVLAAAVAAAGRCGTVGHSSVLRGSNIVCRGIGGGSEGTASTRPTGVDLDLDQGAYLDHRVLKVLRLTRLSKMLRLARLVRILRKVHLRSNSPHACDIQIM